MARSLRVIFRALAATAASRPLRSFAVSFVPLAVMAGGFAYLALAEPDGPDPGPGRSVASREETQQRPGGTTREDPERTSPSSGGTTQEEEAPASPDSGGTTQEEAPAPAPAPTPAPPPDTAAQVPPAGGMTQEAAPKQASSPKGGVQEAPPSGSSVAPEEMLDEQVAGQAGGGSATYSGYKTVRTDNQELIVDVPSSWSDVQSGGNWTIEGAAAGPSITASTNIGAWSNAGAPGVFFGASGTLLRQTNEAGILDYYARARADDGCASYGRYNYQDAYYGGMYDLWEDCGASGYYVLTLVAAPPDRAFVMAVDITMLAEADIEAAKKILDTFQTNREFQANSNRNAS